MRVMFIEPPKDMFFVMGEYLAPPYGIIQLAAYLEREVEGVDVEILDCNAEQTNWAGVKRRIESSAPDIVASSSLATCNTYSVARAVEIAKNVNPNIITVTGGQHFTATAQESLREYPALDVIIRGEGERTLEELVRKLKEEKSIHGIEGISFRRDGEVVHNPSRSLIENLDDLPYPGYHLVKDLVSKYNFAMMAGRNSRFALIEGSRGCSHECSFCTQWRHWLGKWRLKSPKRIAEEMEFCHRNFGSRFIWLTDDNFGAGNRPKELAEEIIKRGMGDRTTWFVQARCDDIIRNREALPRLRKSGLNWILLGVENSDPATLARLGKNITPEDAREAVKLLKENDIFAHVMLIIGDRKDTPQSIRRLTEFANDLDPDFLMFGALTPFPGTGIFEEAKRNGWIEDFNWSHYDMVHAIMPTEKMSRMEVQEQLYECYRSFYGSWKRKLQGAFSSNNMKRRIFRYMAGRSLLAEFKSMFAPTSTS